jgi:hypothetical protein
MLSAVESLKILEMGEIVLSIKDIQLSATRIMRIESISHTLRNQMMNDLKRATFIHDSLTRLQIWLVLPSRK